MNKTKQKKTVAFLLVLVIFTLGVDVFLLRKSSENPITFIGDPKATYIIKAEKAASFNPRSLVKNLNGTLVDISSIDLSNPEVQKVTYTVETGSKKNYKTISIRIEQPENQKTDTVTKKEGSSDSEITVTGNPPTIKMVMDAIGVDAGNLYFSPVNLVETITDENGSVIQVDEKIYPTIAPPEVKSGETKAYFTADFFDITSPGEYTLVLHAIGAGHAEATQKVTISIVEPQPVYIPDQSQTVQNPSATYNPNQYPQTTPTYPDYNYPNYNPGTATTPGTYQ